MDMHVDGGYVDLEVELVEDDTIMAVILTDLPEEFALSNGDSIDLLLPVTNILYYFGNKILPNCRKLT